MNRAEAKERVTIGLTLWLRCGDKRMTSAPDQMTFGSSLTRRSPLYKTLNEPQRGELLRFFRVGFERFR